MKVTLHAFSTALFSSWLMIEELGVLFDCGDGCTTALLQKSRKGKHIFISHPDRDHLGGLFQFMQLNGRGAYPVVYYPADSDSFPKLREFLLKFDPHIELPQWQQIRHFSEIDVHPEYVVKALRNEHVAAPMHVTKSLSFILLRKKKKLKPEYKSLEGKELARLRESTIIDEIQLEPVLAYSGDTPVENDGRWNDMPFLIHESTFLRREESEGETSVRNRHSSLEELIPMVKNSGVKSLMITHFSSRYKSAEIKAELDALCVRHQLDIPVYLLCPGEKISMEVDL